jgi:uncharacterized protein YbjT (DUF2867 family)
MRNNTKSDKSRWIIRALARKPDALKAELDSDLGPNHEVEVVMGDLLCRETLESALSGCSYILFCAGAVETFVLLFGPRRRCCQFGCGLGATGTDIKGKPDGTPRADNEGVANLAAAARVTRYACLGPLATAIDWRECSAVLHRRT